MPAGRLLGLLPSDGGAEHHPGRDLPVGDLLRHGHPVRHADGEHLRPSGPVSAAEFPLPPSGESDLQHSPAVPGGYQQRGVPLQRPFSHRADLLPLHRPLYPLHRRRRSHGIPPRPVGAGPVCPGGPGDAGAGVVPVPEAAQRAGRGRGGLPLAAARVPVRRGPAGRTDHRPAALLLSMGEPVPEGQLRRHPSLLRLHGPGRTAGLLRRLHAAGKIPAGVPREPSQRGHRLRGRGGAVPAGEYGCLRRGAPRAGPGGR